MYKHIYFILLLNINLKFYLKEKTFARNTKKIVFLKDPDFLKKRIEFLKIRSLEVLDHFDKSQRKELNKFLILNKIIIKFLFSFSF